MHIYQNRYNIHVHVFVNSNSTVHLLHPYLMQWSVVAYTNYTVYPQDWLCQYLYIIIWLCVCVCVYIHIHIFDLLLALLSLYLANALRADAICLSLEFLLHVFLRKICLLMYCSTLCSSIYSEIKPSATSSSMVSNAPSPKSKKFDIIQ